MPNTNASTKKQNFWNTKRVENNVKIKEISELLGTKDKSTASYFSGQCIPKKAYLKLICDFFDVDYAKGEEEFINMYIEYWTQRGKPVRIPRYRSHDKFHQNLDVDDTIAKVEKPVKEAKEAKEVVPTDKILEKLYQNIGYDDFMLVRKYCDEANTDDICKALYNKVDLDLFIEIYNLLKN